MDLYCELVLILLHVLAFVRWLRAPIEKQGWLDAMPVVCYAVLALLTKQTGILTIILSGRFLLRQRHWKHSRLL